MINIADQSSLAAFIYTEDWHRSEKLSGVDRLALQNALRERAVAYYLTLDALSIGGRCITCSFFDDTDDDTNVCMMHNTSVTRDNICPDFEELP